MKTQPKIMIVDDEKDIHECLSEILSMHGYTTIVAKSGEEALQLLLKDQGVDLVFCDVSMPGMDGIETLMESRKWGVKTNFVMMSGRNENEIIHQAKEAGAKDCLIKPFDIPSFISKVPGFIGKKK